MSRRMKVTELFVQTPIRTTRELRQRIEKLADKTGRSMNSIMVELVEHGLDNQVIKAPEKRRPR